MLGPGKESNTTLLIKKSSLIARSLELFTENRSNPLTRRQQLRKLDRDDSARVPSTYNEGFWQQRDHCEIADYP
jgi:hypothetical protein